MARLKFPLSRRDKFYIFGDEDKALNDIEDTEFFIKGAIYRPTASRNKDGTVPLEASHFESGNPASKPAIFKRFFDSQQPLASNDESWSNVVPLGGSPSTGTSARNSPQPEQNKANGSDKASLSSQPNMPLGSEAAWGGHHNTTLGTIAEERLDPGDFVIKYYASISDMIWCVFALLLYLADVGTDIGLAMAYLSTGHYIYFGLTIGLVGLASFVMMVASFEFYMRNYRIVGDQGTLIGWLIKTTCLFLQLGPMLRLVDSFIYGLRSRAAEDTVRQKKFYDRMIDEDVDGTMLRMFEAHMEAGPQAILQLWIMTQLGLEAGPVVLSLQCASVAFSVFSLALSMVSFQKSLRVSQPDKALITRPGIIVMFMWRILTEATRITALAMFASKFTWMVFIVIGVHYLIMLFWMSRQETKYCTVVNHEGEEVHSCAGEFFFYIMTAFVHIFDFFNHIEGHTRLRCLVFYGLVFTENLAMILIFYISASVTGTPEWYDLSSVLFVILGFLGGVALQVMYYKACHPNNFSYMHEDRRVKWCIPMSNLSLCADPTWDLDALDRDAESEVMMNPPPVKRTGPPPTQYLRPILRNSGSGSGSDASQRSNFVQKTELDAAAKARMNLKYHKPEKLNDIVNQTSTV